MHVHRRKASRVIVATLAGDFDDVAADVLSFLFKNGGYVGRGTRAECDEE